MIIAIKRDYIQLSCKLTLSSLYLLIIIVIIKVGDNMSYITIKNLTKIYQTGNIETRALDDLSLEISQGELMVIVGASGAGKTTFLNILGGMDEATSGSLIIEGEDITTYSTKELTQYRRHDIGFVFQFYNLIPNITALENVEMATEVVKDYFDEKTILSDVGLAEHLNKFPAQLSGGQQQRVAIARAIAKKPKLLLCDEPTGALDYESGKEILKILQNLAKTYQMTIVIITHNQAIERIANHVVRLKNGAVFSEHINENPLDVNEVEW